MDKIMALVPTSNHQIIAVPIKTFTNSKIQLAQSTSSTPSILPQLTNITPITSSSILPTSIAGLTTLPPNLKISNSLLSIKRPDQPSLLLVVKSNHQQPI